MCLHSPLTQPLLPHTLTLQAQVKMPPPTAMLPYIWSSPAHTGRKLLPKNSNKNKAEKGPRGQKTSPLNECLPRKSSQSLYKTNVHVDFWTSNPLGCRSLYYQAGPGSAAPDVPEVESGAIL